MRIRIRTKLALALAVPLIALGLVASQEVSRAGERSDEVQQEADLATAAAGPTSVISRLQDERNFALIELLGMVGTLELPVASTEEARANTDAAFDELVSFVESSGGDIEEAFARTVEGIDLYLLAVRGQVDLYDGPQDLSIQTVEFALTIYNAYAAFINTIVTDTSGIALDVADADLRTGVELVSRSTIDLEYSAEINRNIFYQSLTGTPLDDARIIVAGHLDDYLTNRQKITERAVGPYEGMPEQWLSSEKDAEQQALYAQFVSEGTADLAVLSEALGSSEVPGMVGLRSDISDAMQARADELVADAKDQRNLVALLAALAVGFALVGTILASFSITRPLHSLTAQAEDMAAERLPRAVQKVLDTPLGEDVQVPHVEPIAVKTRDEVADVADALNTVQRSALDLAVEQAVLRKNIADSFVNLGRRNQELLDRQLDLITDLERRADDPDRLDGLFRLDHLATRMRRNAESLLRLAGGDEVLDGDFGAPVPVVDVIRGALGEVEGYQRVEVMSLDPALIDGSAGADIAHAVAELVENALTFSPPHENVKIRGRRRNDGYVIAVMDQGVGMNEEQLEVANRRLAGQESFTVAPSRYLGHYVAGHLASAHRVRISLQQETLGGITARIDLPSSILIDDAGPVVATAPRPAAGTPVEFVPEAEYDAGYGDVVPEPEDELDAFFEPTPAPVVDDVPAEAELQDEFADEFEDQFEDQLQDEPDLQPEPAFDEPEAPFSPVVPVDLEPEPEPRPAPAFGDLSEMAEAMPADPAYAEQVAPIEREPVTVPAEAPAPEADNGIGLPHANFTGAQVTGLTRRIRGANAPRATNVADAFGGGASSREARPASADDVASFLAAFDGGVSRGLADARSADDEG